jgi:hypothetical protein
MIAPTTTLNEIRQLGLKALAKELGPVGLIRFLQQFETGQGNYTLERESWLTETDLQVVLESIRQRRQAGKTESDS